MIFYSKKKPLKDILGNFFSTNEKKSLEKTSRTHTAKEEMSKFSKQYQDIENAGKSLTDAYNNLTNRKN